MERIFLDEKDNQVRLSALIKAVGVLKTGGSVVVPTDTVYGLAADVFNSEALKNIFALKGRKADKPLPIFVDSFKMLEKVAFVKNKEVEQFLKKSWPGKTTCVLPSRGWMPLEVKGGDSPLPIDRLTIAVRIPDYSFLLELIKRFGGPLTATSANYSGQGPYSDAEEVILDFKHLPFQPDLIIDAGALPKNPPSTIYDCTIWPPQILRR